MRTLSGPAGMIVALALLHEGGPQEPLAFLRSEAGLSASEVAAFDRGEPVSIALDTRENREIALFAAVRIAQPRRAFVDAYRDIERFKSGAAVAAIGRFSAPPVETDLAALPIDDQEITDLRRCRPSDCAFKLAESRINDLRAFDWSGPDAGAKVGSVIRRWVAEYTADYQTQGSAALAVYADQAHRTHVADEQHALLRAAPYLYGYVPALQRYLESYPSASLAEAESFFYWAKERFGLKPTLNTYHVVVFDDPARPDVTVIVSRQIYASHYFEAGVEFYALVDGPLGRGTDVFYVGRSRADALRGTFGGLKKAVAQGRALGALRRAMASIRDRFNRVG